MRRTDTQPALHRAIDLRPAFTLVEMLVVIGILLAVTAMVVVTLRPNDGDKMRTAGRIAQSAILGAKDRALHAKARRGFRLIRDPNDTTIATGFLYVQPLSMQTYPLQSIQLQRPDFDNNNVPDNANVTIVHGFMNSTPPLPNVDWPTISPFFSTPPRIRIPAGSGQWYTFVMLNAAPYAISSTDVYLQLTTPFIDQGTPGVVVSHDRVISSFCSADIELGTEIIPNSQPIPLPSGIVIDLPRSSAAAQVDMMYTPRGALYGGVAGQGLIHLLLRDIRDVTEGIDPTNVAAGVQHRENMIVTINPQTGHCQTYPIDPADVLDNATGNAGTDGIADDLFHFAKIGSAAGQ